MWSIGPGRVMEIFYREIVNMKKVYRANVEGTTQSSGLRSPGRLITSPST